MADPRTLFANERTYLAWLRTTLATLSLGIALAKFGVFTAERGDSTLQPRILGGSFILLGLFCMAIGTYLYRVRDKAILAGTPIPTHQAWLWATTFFVLFFCIMGGIWIAS